MTTGVLCPVPILQFFDNTGKPAVGGSILTQVGGVNAATYSDINLTVPLPNPIPLNSRGEASTAAGATAQVFLTPNTVYTFTISDVLGNILDTPQYVNGTQITQAIIGQTLWPRNAAEIAASVTPVNYAYIYGAIARYVTNTAPGVTDCGAGINAALSCNTVVTLDAQEYYTSVTVAIPVGCLLKGAGINETASNPIGTNGSIIIGALTLTPVVQVSASSTSGGASFKGISVLRAAGIAATTAIGIEILGGIGNVLEDVLAYSHGKGFYLNGNSASPNGLSTMFSRCYTGDITDAHLVVDTWPEARFVQCRFGTDGTGDVNCNAYVRVQGGNTGFPAAGPNTLSFAECQFNQGTNSPAYWFQMQNFAGSAVDNSIIPEVVNCHIEAVGTAMLSTDSTWTNLNRMGLVNNSFYGSVPFFALNAATVLNGCRVVGNYIAQSSFSPAVNDVNSFVVNSNVFDACTVNYSAGTTGGWTVTSLGNIYENSASCTVSGTVWNQALFADTYDTGSTFTNQGTPNKAITVINPGQSLINWTPQLAFSSATTGITYSTTDTLGTMQVVGNKVSLLFRILLTSCGSASGSAQITGFPVPQNTQLWQTGGGGLITQCSSMTNLSTAPIICNGVVAPPPGYIILLQQTATGTAPVTNGSFTNTTQLSGLVEYFL